MLRLLFSEDPVWDLRRWVSGGTRCASRTAGEPPAGAEGKGRERMLVNGATITGKGAGTAKGRSAEDTEQIRVVLRQRFDDPRHPALVLDH